MTRLKRLRVRGTTVIALLAFASALFAQESSTTVLTLDHAIALALERNPELVAASQEILATEAAVTQAGVLPSNYSLQRWQWRANR